MMNSLSMRVEYYVSVRPLGIPTMKRKKVETGEREGRKGEISFRSLPHSSMRQNSPGKGPCGYET